MIPILYKEEIFSSHVIIFIFLTINNDDTLLFICLSSYQSFQLFDFLFLQLFFFPYISYEILNKSDFYNDNLMNNVSIFSIK